MLPGIEVQQLYIKWHEKLSLTANKIYVTKSSREKSEKLPSELIKETLSYIKWFEDWIETVSIAHIELDDINATFRYKDGEKGRIILRSSSMTLDAKLDLSNDYFFAHLTFDDKQRDIEVKGVSVIDLGTLTSYSKLNISAVKSADITLYLRADQDELAFTLDSNRPITDLRPIVDLFQLHEKITPWIVDYSSGTAFHLHSMKGGLSYDNPKEILNTLYAQATYTDFSYKFQPGLPPIKTSHTDFVFEKGVLNIIPKNAYYCKQRTGESWLDIDFNPEEEPVLNAYVITTSQLDQDLIDLLDYFDIPLPFLQSEGVTQANLTLNIPLLSVDVKANGDFYIEKGEVLFRGVPWQVTNSTISLHNSKVTVEKVNIGYEKILQASVDGLMDFGGGKTDLKIKAKEFTLNMGESLLSLDNNRTQLMIDYKLSPKSESVTLSASAWKFNDQNISIASFRAPFNFDSVLLNMPNVSGSLGDYADFTAEGPVNLAKLTADLKIDLLRLELQSIILDQAHFPFSAHYDENLTITSYEDMHLNYADTDITAGPSIFTINKESLSIVKNHFSIANLIESELGGSYNISKGLGEFTLHDFVISNEDAGDLFKTDKEIAVNIINDKKAIFVSVPSLTLNARTKRDGWKLSFSDFGKLSEHSTLMRDYNLTDGSLTIETETGSEPYRLNGKVNYPYPFIVDDKTPVNDYIFYGSIQNGKTKLNVNENIDIDISDRIKIRSKNIGYNSDAIINFIKDHPSDDNQTNLPSVTMTANNSFMHFSPKSRALADMITLDMNGTQITASLLHKKGIAIFELNDKTFYADGQLFGGEFMTGVFAASEFEGGNLLFNVNGTLEHADGVLYIDNTTLKEYKALNNILAFINTVPSLATFSLPGYSKKGIKVDEAYARFTHKNNKIFFDSIKLDSKEMDIVGTGFTDYMNNKIDMDMTFKTDLGTTVSKIPVVGYLLLGKDGSISTSFKVTGALDDPEVETQTVKDVAVAPFNIIKRAVTLPFWIFSSEEEE